MLTKAEIQSVNYTGNTCTIRVPFFENAASIDPAVVEAQIMCLPGIYNGYVPGDMVWVEFENGLMDRPVVTGKVYTGVKSEKNCDGGALQGTTLEVTGTTILSDNTTFKGLETQYNSVKKIQDTLKKVTAATDRNNFSTVVTAAFAEKYCTYFNSNLTQLYTFDDKEIPCTFVGTDISKITDGTSNTTKILIDAKGDNNMTYIRLGDIANGSGLDLSDDSYNYSIAIGDINVKYYKDNIEVPVTLGSATPKAQLHIGIGCGKMILKDGLYILTTVGVVHEPAFKRRRIDPLLNLVTGNTTGVNRHMLASGDFTQYILGPDRYAYSWDPVCTSDSYEPTLDDIKNNLNNITAIMLYVEFPDSSEGLEYDEVKVLVDGIKIIKYDNYTEANVQFVLNTNNYYNTNLPNSNTATFVNNLFTVVNAKLPIIVGALADIICYNAETGTTETLMSANSQSSAILTVTGSRISIDGTARLPVISIYTDSVSNPIIKNVIPIELDSWTVTSVMTNKL